MEVKIVELQPMRVACSHALGASPEMLAFEKMFNWAKPLNILEGARSFGFNNPNPEPNKPEYGYEVWITVDESVAASEDITIRDFEGGLYAVSEVVGAENIGQVWQDLVNWQQNSDYQRGQHQWLEEHLGSVEVPPEELHLKLYIPLAK